MAFAVDTVGAPGRGIAAEETVLEEEEVTMAGRGCDETYDGAPEVRVCVMSGSLSGPLVGAPARLAGGYVALCSCWS